MEAPWNADKCILWLKVADLTAEHLIPKSIGGRLTSRFFCKPCNDRLGHDIEADAKHDPAITSTIYQFAEDYPDQAGRLAERSRLRAHSKAGSVPAERRDGDIQVKSHRIADGSILQPTPQARETLRRLLVKNGLEEGPLEEALRRFDDADENQPLDLGSISVTKWTITAVSPDTSGPPLHDLVPVKTAYEFLAGHLGTAVYEDLPPLKSIREALRTGTPSDSIVVERLVADRAEPIHGILFEGNHPHAQVQVRLFGHLAYRVHFIGLAVGGQRFAYTHRLDTDEEILAEAVNNVAT